MTCFETQKLLSKDIADLDLKLECMGKRLDAMEVEGSEQDDAEHLLYNNTGGFHLGCILSSAMASESHSKIGFLKHPLVAAIASISLVFIQLISLNILEIENRLMQFNYHQDCTELKECSTNHYCEISEKKCWDCDYVNETCPDDFNSTDTDFLGRYSSFEIYTNEVGPSLSEEEYTCFSKLYCNQHKITGKDDACPYWTEEELDFPKNAGTYVVITFIAAILAYSIFSEMKQVISEEAFYMKFIDNNERRNTLAACLLRISLFLRRTYLPWVSFLD